MRFPHYLFYTSYGNPLTFYLTGVLGIKVKIMLPWDQTGKIGPKKPLPDNVSIVEPKEETIPATPYSESKQQAPPMAQQQPAAQ